jgi:hypothetical protein
MDENKPWWQIISENTPLALTLIGGLLFVIGAAGGWPTPQIKVTESGWRIASAVLGTIALGIGIWLMLTKETRRDRTSPTLDAKRYGIKITSPVKNASVAETFKVHGEYQVKPADNIVAKVLDLSPASSRYWPKKVPVVFEDDKTWSAGPIGIGKIKTGEERIIVVAIMNRSGQTLCDYYHVVADQINELRKLNNDDTIRLPGIVAPNPDIVECHRVRVVGS